MKRKWIRMSRWLTVAGLLQFGGCITNAQWVDFAFTEVARVISGFAGFAADVFVQSQSTTQDVTNTAP